jgi:type I restriction enzyme S subunit
MKPYTEDNSITWEILPFTESLDDRGIPKPGKVLARDYKAKGQIPVVDQGQQLVAGWTDDETLAIRDRLPLIVFGDHTRAFKFVDFPFALGADGTQLLKPNGDFNPRFFYYACLQIPLPNRGYNRHFTVLKEQKLPKPPKREQEKIAAVLLNVQRAMEIEDRLITASHQLKQSAMHQLLTRGIRGEPQKESESGPIPESWNLERLEDCCDVLSSSLSYTDFAEMSEPASGDSVPAMGIKVSDMNLPDNESRIVRANLQKLLPTSLAEKKLVPPDTVVFPKRGAAIATNKKRMTTAWTVLDPNLIGVRAGEGVNSDFLFYWFQNFDLRIITEPGPTPQLNKKNLTPLLLPIPEDPDEQAEIVEILQTIDRKISAHELKQATLQELFKTLLNQLMTGHIHVNELDIDTSEVTGTDGAAIDEKPIKRRS